MVASAAAVLPRTSSKADEDSFASVVVVSVVFHLLVFIGIPLLATVFYHAEKYERPKTFTLVNMPPRAVIQQKAAQVAMPKPKAANPVPAKKKAKQAAKKEEKAQEDKDQLNELLDAIPSRVSDMSVSKNFKFNWYTQNMQSRIEENFKPPMGLTDKKDAAVIVSFTVYENGNISGISVVRSSGISTLDNCAVQAVTASAPFGKLPLTFSEKKLEPTVTLYYVKK
jgi:TonB family protein